MPHLNPEDIARLVEEAPSPAEAGHLDRCAECTEALADLRRQTAALAALPPLDPPPGEWSRIEALLRAEGLVRGSTHGRFGFVATAARGWSAAAAVLVAFLVGGAGGFALRGAAAPPANGLPRVFATPPASSSTPVTVEDAEGQVRIAEAQYLDALERYNQLLGPQQASGVDPWAARLAALESIVASTRTALHEAPYDPVINGYYINASAQRDAMIRQISTDEVEPWY